MQIVAPPGRLGYAGGQEAPGLVEPTDSMKRRALVLALLAASPGLARAGEVACWYEQGVIVAPASVAGLAGDYILDTGSPITQLHETKAQAAGMSGTAQVGDVRLAGLDLSERPFTVIDLDSRTWAFPTPIAGVIGADVLGGYVVDVSFSPCRVSINPSRTAPAFAARTILALDRIDGAAAASAAVTDGPTAFADTFVLSTGADAGVRFDQARASVPGAARIEDLLPGGERRARLRAASFAGTLFENIDAGLAGPGLRTAGAIGAPILSRWRLRFDFPSGRLLLAPAG